MKLSDFVPLGNGVFKIEGPSKIQGLGIHPTVSDMLILRYAGTLTNLTANTFQEGTDVFVPSPLEDSKLSTVVVDCVDGRFVDDQGKKEQLAPAISKVLPRMTVGERFMIVDNLEDNEQKLIGMDHLDNSGQEPRREPKEETRQQGKIYVVKLIRVLTQPEAELIRVVQGLEPEQRNWDTIAVIFTTRIPNSYRMSEIRELWDKIWGYFRNAGPYPLSNINKAVEEDS